MRTRGTVVQSLSNWHKRSENDGHQGCQEGMAQQVSRKQARESEATAVPAGFVDDTPTSFCSAASSQLFALSNYTFFFNS